MEDDQLPDIIKPADVADLPATNGERLLTRQEFQQLSDVPAALVWLANIENPNTRRA